MTHHARAYVINTPDAKQRHLMLVQDEPEPASCPNCGSHALTGRIITVPNYDEANSTRDVAGMECGNCFHFEAEGE